MKRPASVIRRIEALEKKASAPIGEGFDLEVVFVEPLPDGGPGAVVDRLLVRLGEGGSPTR